MISKQELYNLVISYDMHDIPTMPGYIVAPSVDNKMINFLKLNYETMRMDLVGRFNISSIAPNPNDSATKVKKILSISPCLEKHKPIALRNKKVLRLVVEITPNNRILCFIQTEPYFQLIKSDIKITNKLSFYNRSKGLKYIPSMDRTFSIGFTRAIFENFVCPLSSIEICMTRDINDSDREQQQGHEPMRVNLQGEEVIDCSLKVSKLWGRNFSDNVLRPFKYNPHNHNFYLLVDRDKERLEKEREA